jgi:hypothetical protein
MDNIGTNLKNKYILIIGSEERNVIDYIIEEWKRVASDKDKLNVELKERC